MSSTPNTPPVPDALTRLARTYEAQPGPARAAPSRIADPRVPTAELTLEERHARSYVTNDTEPQRERAARAAERQAAPEAKPDAANDSQTNNDPSETNDVTETNDTETPPARYTVADPEVQTALSDAARELKIDDEGMQRLVNKVGPVLDARAAKRMADVTAGWDRDTRNDPEIGGKNLTATIDYAKKAVALGTPALRELLGTGIGNHPEVVRWAAAMGRRLAATERTQTAPPLPEDAQTRLAKTCEREPARPFTPPARRMSDDAMSRLARGYRTV